MGYKGNTMKRVILAIAAVLMCGCLFTGCPKNVPVNEPELTEEEKLEQIKEVCQKFVDFAPTLSTENNEHDSTYCWTNDGNIGICFGFWKDDRQQEHFSLNIVFYYEDDSKWTCNSMPLDIEDLTEYTKDSLTFDITGTGIKQIYIVKLENDCIHLITETTEEGYNLMKQTISTWTKDLYFYPVN